VDGEAVISSGGTNGKTNRSDHAMEGET